MVQTLQHPPQNQVDAQRHLANHVFANPSFHSDVTGIAQLQVICGIGYNYI
jgi:hypothetical protein